MNYKLIFNDIKTMVDKYPNNMELGKRAREYMNILKDDKRYIYESPDGGETVYRRKFEDYDNKEKI